MRPEYIANILAGLERYNPETTSIFQDYVQQQCESRTYDCYANLALLKLWVAFYMFLFLSFERGWMLLALAFRRPDGYVGGMEEGSCFEFDGGFLVHHDDFIYSRSLLPEKANLLH